MKIGPYELISELGRGGMAQVWLAHKVWDDGKRRPCVVKLPRRNAVADEGLLRQFLEEARLSIQLRHNNIVSVFDAGVHEELPYLVMNYVAGKDLAQLLRATSRLDARWEVETAIHVVREVGQGLIYAHELEQQIIHRDVASKNVMIDGSGGVLLTDFGVATSLSTLTSRVHVKGTLSYMAPEHYLGQACPASDVFGLGGIFWEMLAGRRFREGLPEGQELITAVVEGAVDPVGRALPAEVARVLGGMLAPSAGDRLSLTEVLNALEDFPNRRRALGRMISLYFGRAGRRTGLSQVHFAASKELVDTFAVARAAGVSLSKVREPRRPGQPHDVPEGFEPVAVPRTSRVDPLTFGDALDDDLDPPEPRAPEPRAPTDEDEEITTDWSPAREPDAPRRPIDRRPPPPAASRPEAASPVQEEPEPPTIPLGGMPSSAPVIGDVVFTTSRRARPDRASIAASFGRSQGSPWSSMVASGRSDVATLRKRGDRGTPRRGVGMLVASLAVGLVAGAWMWGPIEARTVARSPARSGSSTRQVTMASRGPAVVAVAAPPMGAAWTSSTGGSTSREPPTGGPSVDALAGSSGASWPDVDASEPPPPPPSRPRPRPPSPPVLEFIVRRGLAVSFAEIRVDRSRAHVVPARGAASLRVKAGPHTLRFRARPDGPWRALRFTFSPGMRYVGQLELEGLRVVAVPDEEAEPR